MSKIVCSSYFDLGAGSQTSEIEYMSMCLTQYEFEIENTQILHLNP